MSPDRFASNCLLQIRNSLWVALLAGALPSSAAAGVRAGVEIGLNYSSLHYDDLSQAPAIYWDPGWRPSFTGGVTLQVPLRGKFDLVTGLRYVQQGNRVKYNDPTFPPVAGEFRVIQEYFSVPALLTYYPMMSRRLSFSIGPEIGLLISAHTTIEYSTPPFGGQSTDENVKDSLETTNVTVDASAGYEFPIEKRVGIVSLRYTHGLTGVAKKGDWATDWKTRGIELLVGMRW